MAAFISGNTGKPLPTTTDTPTRSPDTPLQAVGEVVLRLLGALLHLLTTLAIVRTLDPQSAGVYFRGFVIACGLGALLRNKYELYLAHYILDERALRGGPSVGAVLKSLGKRVLIRSTMVCGLLLVITADLDIYAPRLQPILETYLPFVLAIPFVSLSMFIGETLRAANRTLLGTIVAAYALNLSILVVALLAPSLAPEMSSSGNLLVWFAWAFFAGSVAAAGLAVLLAWRAFPIPAGDQSHTLSKACYAAIDERAVIGFAKGLLLWGPLCLLAVWAPAVQMASYAVAARTAQIVDFFLPALSLAVYREVAVSQQAPSLQSRTFTAVATSSVIILALLLLAPATLEIFGPPYAAQLPIYALLLGVHWANGAGRPAIRVAAQDWDELMIRRTLGWGAAAAVLLCALLLPRYGAFAAALGALLGALIVNTHAIVWGMTRRAQV